jgi:hypothetical protein
MLILTHLSITQFQQLGKYFYIGGLEFWLEFLLFRIYLHLIISFLQIPVKFNITMYFLTYSHNSLNPILVDRKEESSYKTDRQITPLGSTFKLSSNEWAFCSCHLQNGHSKWSDIIGHIFCKWIKHVCWVVISSLQNLLDCIKNKMCVKNS